MAKSTESLYVHVTELGSGRQRRFTKFIWDGMKPATREQYQNTENAVAVNVKTELEYQKLVKRARGLEKDKKDTAAKALWAKAEAMKPAKVIDAAVVEADKAYTDNDFVGALELYEAAEDPLNEHVINRIAELSKNVKK